MDGNRVGRVTAGDSQLVVNYALQFQATCPEVEGHLELWELPLTAKPACPATAVVTSVVCNPTLPGSTVALGLKTLVLIEGCRWDNAPGKHSKCQDPDATLFPPISSLLQG